MIRLRRFGLGVCVLALAACGQTEKFSELDAINNAQGAGTPFTQALTEEYRVFANGQKDEKDYSDSLHFARKGITTSTGEAVMPEPISDWHLSPENMRELDVARGRLVTVLDYGARDALPQDSARAQALFDCWIEQQEEDWHANPPCKNQFLDALNAISGAMPPPVIAAEEPAPAMPDPSVPMKKEDATYLVFFDLDKADIRADGASTLDVVAEEIKSRQLNGVRVVGHADTSGTHEHNDKLSARRANAVRDSLASRGIDASLIRTDSRGENEPLVETGDGVREPANRRAQITFE